MLLCPPLIGGGIKQCFCLTSVCLTSVAYIGHNSRTERLRKNKIGTEVARVTRDSDTTFKVKGQGHQAALVGCTGRLTWTYSNGHLSICVHDLYIYISEMTYTVSSGTLNSTIPYNTWRISCHHMQAWAEAYRGGCPPTAVIFVIYCMMLWQNKIC